MDSKRRAALHRALDAVMDARRATDGLLRWNAAPAPTGRYSSFAERNWPTADYSNGAAAVALYADKPYSKANADGGSVIQIRVADWSVGKTEEGRKRYGGFVWRTLVQRAATLSQAKQMAEAFLSQHKEFAK